MSVAGKVIAITGASSGIGRATAVLLAQRGAALMLGARRESELQRFVQQISEAGGQAEYRAMDVTLRAEVKAFVTAATTRFGRLDVIINNAGIGPISRFDDCRVDDWDAMIDVNLRGTLHGIGAALPIFQQQQSGHIVNVVSTAGLQIAPTMGVYGATKNAVRTVSEALRQESPNVRVTEVSPGFVATGFSKTIGDADIRNTIEKRQQELGIPPETVAGAIAYAIDQPCAVDIGSIVTRPTAQN
ncbi:MAG: SDR family oxidoreductase [Parasphingopyxis sp.]|uniref:SDR family oxidoreductase n=1 Tax=Parasphingopyxis sp. TaxID=1920299 RepID=UPI0032EE68B7